MTMRLGRQAGEVLDRNRWFTFRWNGELYPAYAGDTIVSALAACGKRVFSRSFKYHRPRGAIASNYLDPGCMMQVGDEPNVRGAHRRVAPGMDVRAQNAWPSLRFDVKSVNGLMGRFLSAGFYYKTFIKPQFLQPAYQSVLRRFAAGGKVSAESPHGYYDKRYAHPDVLIAGGGLAGMAAALSAAQTGANVMLVEEEYELGGHLRWGSESELGSLRELRDAIAGDSRIEVLTNSVVTGRYDDNWIAVLQRGLPHIVERLIKARAKTLIVAPGLVERPYVFEGNDLPGVMLSTAVRKFINLYAVKPGTRAVVFTANGEGDSAVADLRRAGVDIATVADARRGADIVRAIGTNSVRAVELSNGSKFDCDLLVTAAGWTAPTSLLNMAGARPVYEPRAARFLPGDGLPSNVMLAGGIAGDGSHEELVTHARAVGAAAAARAGFGSAASIPALGVQDHPALFRGRTHGFVDFSEDVASKDIIAAAKEGYDSIELMKRYTTATMGGAQGKLETVNATASLAEAMGQTIAETGTTMWRPPYVPITLGALAGRKFEPVRYSPMQPWHQARRAVPLVAGQWIRPEHYGNPEAEVRNVRQNVGIIDVTPLGKLDLRGPDVPKLLNLLYTNKWSKLDIGAVRYGVMCSSDGVVLDDGVTGRLEANRYLMTTTSSGAGMVWEWVENWLQTGFPNWKVHVTPVTTAYASINIAGPKSRELLSRVVEGVDLSPQAFPYMNVRMGKIAGVDNCFMWRIGFTGELSFEIHVPAAYGLYIWETLMNRGLDLGVGPFGVEAQRIMRLEKGHLIVGQDTDGMTHAFSAGLEPLIKLDKEDFVGKTELAWLASRSDYPRLVSIQPQDGSIVPPEASQIVEGNKRIMGRITSSRMSPTLGRSICLGLVDPQLAKPGTVVTVLLPDGRRIAATVMPHLAHFDPEGKRLRG